MEEENKRVEGEIDLQGEVSKEKFLSLSLSLFLSLFTKIEEGTNVGKTVEKSTYDVSIHWMKRERKASVTRISRSPDDDEENVFFGGEGRVNVDLSVAHFPNVTEDGLSYTDLSGILFHHVAHIASRHDLSRYFTRKCLGRKSVGMPESSRRLF